MAIVPGAINSPVCWVNASGQDRYASAGNLRLARVTPCMYPWQIPIGVMTHAQTIIDETDIQTTGEFRVPAADVYPHYAYEVASLTDLHGRRVYYDPFNGKYIVQEVFSLDSEARAIYPGSATIGYITDVNMDDQTVGIMIDPRPPITTYVVGLASTSTTWSMGMPVTLNPENNVITPCTSSSTQFAGVVVDWLEPLPVPSPIGNIAMVVATCGPAWYPLDDTKFYTQNSRDDLLSAGITPTTIPIDITGAACSLGNTASTLIIGNITLRMWYSVGNSNQSAYFPTYAMLDVKRHIPESSSVTVLQPFN